MAGGTGLILAAAALAAASVPGSTWHRCADGDAETAIAACSEVIAGGERLAEAHYNRGIAWRARSQQGRANRGADPERALDSALADYDAAIRLKPLFAEAYVGRAIAWFDRGRYDLAIADCDRAIRLRPDLAEAWNNRALARYKQGRYDLAQPDFDRTIRLRKNYGNALILRSLPAIGSTSATTPDQP